MQWTPWLFYSKDQQLMTFVLQQTSMTSFSSKQAFCAFKTWKKFILSNWTEKVHNFNKFQSLNLFQLGHDTNSTATTSTATKTGSSNRNYCDASHFIMGRKIISSMANQASFQHIVDHDFRGSNIVMAMNEEILAYGKSCLFYQFFCILILFYFYLISYSFSRNP